MPGRSFAVNNSYRYGFNGKENDKSAGNDNYDYGARMYDGRLGRWLSVDPLEVKMPGWSPYNYCFNNPISLIDPDGREPEPKYRYENINKNRKYGTVLVLPMNYKSDPVMLMEYNAAKEEGMPMIFVSGINGLAKSIKRLKDQKVDFSALSISQHGNKGNFTIGDNSRFNAKFPDGGNFTTEKGGNIQLEDTRQFQQLSGLIKGKIVFIGECLVTYQNDPSSMKIIQSFSDITQAMFITSDHSVPGGYTYKGNDKYLNNNEKVGWIWDRKYEDGKDYNDYHIFRPNQKKSQEVYNLKIRQNGWFIWENKESVPTKKTNKTENYSPTVTRIYP
jgi:RHS repeat-associated protein